MNNKVAVKVIAAVLAVLMLGSVAAVLVNVFAGA